MEEKLCLDCGKPIKAGRKDKKFCDDMCRTNYNNNKDKTAAQELSVQDFIKKIQGILEKNRQILDQLLREGNGRTRFEIRDVMGRGFNFKYFTSRAPTLEDEIYCFCFEMGYKEIDNDRLLIVRREREIIC